MKNRHFSVTSVLFVLFSAALSLHAASDVTLSTAATTGGSFAGTNPNVFTPTAASATANTTTIQISLNGGNAVTIHTAGGAGGNGDLTVGGVIAKSGGASSVLTLNAVRDLLITGGSITSSSGALPVVINAGRNVTQQQPITSNGGNITLNPTGTFEMAQPINAGAGQVALQAGTLQSASSVTLTGSTVQVAAGAALRMHGTVDGALTVQGSVSPAPLSAAGNVQVNGTLTLQSTATTQVDLGGTSGGGTYDRVGVSGAVVVGGTLQVNLVNSFHDTIHNSHVFTIIQGGSVTGAFTGLPDGSRITLANDYGSLRVNYTATAVTLDDWRPVITDLTWDPGIAETGTNLFSNTNTRAGRHYFRVLTQSTDIGAWRSRLAVASGEASLYIAKTTLPTTTSFHFASTQTGADGVMLRDDQFAEGEEWFILVNATAGAQWGLFSGRAFVHDLGALPFTDTNGNSQYDIGEAVSPQTAPSTPMPPEGIRFYKSTVPTGTPAWSLWLNGSTRHIALRTSKVPFHSSSSYYIRRQAGQMLVVPTVLGSGSSAYFMSVEAPPGESIGLDSRIQVVTDISFQSTTSNVAVAGAPYRVFRTQVPIDQLAWDVSTTAVAGNPNVAVRKNNVPGEWDNDAYSDAPGATTDSVTLVPDFLTNGTWFITVWGTGNYTFTLKSGDPVITPMNFTDLKTNDQTARAGWRYYALTDIPSQVGSLGWELLLGNQVPGSMISIRRNKVPSRWIYRADGNTSTPSDTQFSYMDYYGLGGFLQRPGHQADVWYVGIYTPLQPLGAFTLDSHVIAPATVGFNGSNTAVTGLEPGRWKFQRIDVPAGVEGWDVRLKNVTGAGQPQLVVRRDQLAQNVGTGLWTSPESHLTWPSGYSWSGELDWTNRSYEAGSNDGAIYYRRLVMGMGGPLEPGTYYVGVYNADPGATTSYTLESRGIGTGQSVPVGTLGYANGSMVTISNLAPREAAYYKVTIPASTPSWEFTLSPTTGEMMMGLRRGAIPDFRSDYEYGDVQYSSYHSAVRVQKAGAERYVLLPYDNQDFLVAGDYYIAVVSEGESPADGSHTGTGTSSGVLTSNGPLTTTNLGAASLAGITQSVSLVGGAVKSYQFTVPAGTASLEVRLENRVGNPNMALVSGSRIATRYPGWSSGSYGYFGGQHSGAVSAYDDNILTVANPAEGTYSLLLRADPDGSNYVDASANLVIIASTPVPVDFDGGTSAVSGQPPAAWRYFQITVPAGVEGWDLRVKNVTGSGFPQMVVRRDQLPQSVGTTQWSSPEASTTWPTGYSWAGELDWTNRSYDAGSNDSSIYYRRLVMGMDGPLEPGTYYVGVYNADPSNATSYTLETKGIGAGQSIQVGTLNHAAGSTATITNLPPREAAYYKVTIAEGTPGWEFTLAPSIGEMMMCLRRGTIPDFRNDYDYTDAQYPSYKGQVRVQKTGPERYVLLPYNNEDSLTAGDYYIAVVSEGVSPSDGSHTGTGTSSGLLTSHGALNTMNLGTAGLAAITQPVGLLGGQVKSFQFTVPAGTASLEVRLDNRVGNPNMALVSGSRIATRYPGWTTGTYGYYGGQASGDVALYDDNIITVANPPAGPFSLLMRADPVGSDYLDASANVVIIANTPQPMAFDGGTASVSSQSPSAWSYFQITVPAGVEGWDLRVKNVTGGYPQLVVRRDQLPQSVSTTPWGSPEGHTNWQSGYYWAGELDWTNRSYDAGGNDSTLYYRRLVSATGGPLEPGTYFVGVFNGDAGSTTSYTVESKGIGAGQSVPVGSLSFTAGSSVEVNNLAPREAAYYKVSIPASTPSWELTLAPTTGEMMMCVRRGGIPDFRADYENSDIQTTSSLGEVRVQKSGPERYVLLPLNNADYLLEGDYYVAVVSEGVNPSDSAHTGTGTSSGVLTSHGALPTESLGVASLSGITHAVSLVGGQVKSCQFTVPAGTASLELRLDNRVGNPNMALVSGSRIATRYPGWFGGSYGYYGGQHNGTVSLYDDNLITVSNPPAGTYSLLLRADPAGSEYPDATSNVVIRQLPRLPLNYAASLNGNGQSHTATRQLLDTQKDFYEVAVPTLLGGQPVIGWLLKMDHLQGDTTLRVYKTWGSPDSGIALTGNSALIVPPFLTPGDTWYVEVQGAGLTNYTITSHPITLERPVWTMPTGHNTTFGDSGNDAGGTPLPGDQGVDIGQDDWHFFAIDVPAGNAGLLRTELQAINGNPNLYIREDGVPTTDHYTAGANGNPLVHRSLTAAASEYGNWVPWNGRYEKQLHTGRWYLGVKASGGTNARYRLKVSTGQVTDLSLNGGAVTNQIVVGRDWRYYRFTVPQNAPNNWALTFSQQVGDVSMWLRDTVPPGNGADGLETTDGYFSSYGFGIKSWYYDYKNQGPYSYNGQDDAGAYNFTTPSLRPGGTYYVGFRAANDATFSLSSATSGGTIGTFTDLDFFSGTLNNVNVAAGGSVIYRIPVPPEATRMKWTSAHSGAVELRLEQGTLPATTGTQHWTSNGGSNVSFNQSLTNVNGWPWQPDHNYYLRVTNTSGADESLTLTLAGKTAATEDEDTDGLPDQWETQYFTYAGAYGAGDDPDGDGVTNAVEFADGTIPNDVNSAKYFLTLSGLNGSADTSPNLPKYDRGSMATITATPTSGHSFIGWQRVGSYGDDFAIQATGTITIPADGTYTFGINATGGSRLKVNNVTVINDNNTYSGTDKFGEITLTAGTYPLELRSFEYFSGESLELFAAAGSHSSFNSSFKLVGDAGQGGLVAQTTDGGPLIPGFTVRQVIAVGTGNIHSLARMDELLNGTRPKRAEVTVVLSVINNLGSGTGDGHFPGGLNFPLQQPQYVNPMPLPMYGDYVLAALNGISLSAALDAPAQPFFGEGEAPWVGGLSAQASDGVDHAGSGPIIHNQSSSLTTTVAGPGTLTFRWKVSSEAGGDRLQFLVDGNIIQQISGEQDYALVNYTVPAGAHTLAWRYIKDGAVTSGADRGWVDQINFGAVRYTLTVNASGGTVNVSPQQADYAADTEVTLTATPGGGNTFIGWSGDLTGTTNPATLILDDNKTVTAIFGLSLPVALDTPGRVYTLGGDASWYGQTLIHHDGVDAARTGDIGDDEETWMETTVTGAGTLTFWWKVSSESGWDFLEFSIDGVLQTSSISGEVNWSQITCSVSGEGPHTLRWRYSKDGSLSHGQDSGFVDQVEWTPAGVTFTSWMATWFTAGEMADPQITGPAVDPNKDGIPNLLAYALDIPPAGHGTSISSVVTVILHNNGTDRRLRGSLNVPDPLPADVTYTIECSNSLGSGATWTPIATGTAAGGWSGNGAITEDAPASGRRIIHVRDIQVVTPGIRRFVRLKVSQ